MSLWNRLMLMFSSGGIEDAGGLGAPVGRLPTLRDGDGESLDFGEPWDANRWNGDFGLFDRDGRHLGSESSAVAPGCPREHLQRIAACVNACRGLPTSELDRLPHVLRLAGQLAHSHQDEDEGRRLRDELQALHCGAPFPS
ncbi:MAG: hypothetical protein KF774_10400 [Planctomyces sp.]|nr:hypothetical protein [Planctomyces sp.]